MILAESMTYDLPICNTDHNCYITKLIIQNQKFSILPLHITVDLDIIELHSIAGRCRDKNNADTTEGN